MSKLVSIPLHDDHSSVGHRMSPESRGVTYSIGEANGALGFRCPHVDVVGIAARTLVLLFKLPWKVRSV